MPSPTPRDNDDQSPFFPPPATTRPPVLQDFGSDSSVDTLSSFASSDNSEYSSHSASSDHPYSRLVVVEALAMGPPSDGAWDTSLNLAETGGSRSVPGPRACSFASTSAIEPDLLQHPASLVSPSAFATAPSTTTLRHQSLPGLITSPEAERRNNITPQASLFQARASVAPSSYDEFALSDTPDHSPALPSPAIFAPLNLHASTSTARYPAPTSSAITASMTRSHSSSLSQLPSPRPNRPGSAGTYSSATSSTSSRPWVRDSDASSVCSGGSGGCWSGPGGGAEEEDGSGEVLKVAGDGVEFLDPRPEPKGARLSINREDTKVVILTVVLPGFSLDNITVAMRRGHKIHIVADSYGESGGHFEKLISLGSGVSSAAPRAEFNGTELKVYVQRRTPRSAAPPAPAGKEDPSPSASPSFSPSSPSSSSISSLSSLSLATSPVVPSGSSFFNTAEDEPPIVTRSTADYPDSLHRKKGSRSLCGPEGAKAAAKQAREEAAQRAREEAKALPKVGRRVVLGARAAERDVSASSEPLAVPPNRNGTIKGRSASPISPGSASESTSSGESTSTRSSIDSASTDPSSADEASSTSPARPKFRGSNLTLRPADRTSFLEASLREDQRRAAAEAGSTSPSSEGSAGGSATPKLERGESTWGFSSVGAPAERRKVDASS